MKLTYKKLVWFQAMLEEIEKRGTVCTDYIYHAKYPSNSREELSVMEPGTDRFPGTTTMKKWLRGEYSFTTFPTKCLWDDEALIRYREEKEKGEKRQLLEKAEAQKQRDLQTLKKLQEKYPESSGKPIPSSE
jgi:hypothetical protein